MEHRSQFLIHLTKFTQAMVLTRLRDRRGFALLLVLASVALIALLLGAFLLATNSEVGTAASSATDSQTQTMAANATQLVISQIRDATSEGSANSTGMNYAWASQPGMIRTFNNDATGSPHFCYKLYSSANMVENGTTYQNSIAAGTPEDYPTSWYNSPGTYTDLNEPVRDATSAMNYPILDPSGCASFTAPTSTAPYILGFTVNGAPTNPGTSVFANPVPMPVAWLYVLKNGQVISPDAGGNGNVVTFKSATTVPTTANPLVGRMAFWTDDETCKVNINTAGEGLFWDMPRGASDVTGSATSSPADAANPVNDNNEYFYSQYQPAAHEFQRYPGHPAQVALSPILGPGYNILVNSEASVGGGNTFPTTPRLAGGGSQLGTVAYNSSTLVPVSFVNAPRKSLYASIDELMFANINTSGPPSYRNPTDLNYSSPRIPSGGGGRNGSKQSSINKASLQAAKFFLTAHSRAPEVNVFNLPRIACWPIDQDVTTHVSASPPTLSAYGSGYDHLIAFCSSITAGGKFNPYYFQRSAAAENNGPETNYDASIARNQSLYKYLQSLTGLAEPGFGGQSLSTKYTQDNNQILTEIEDYIRCTNLFDLNLSTTANTYIGTAAGVNNYNGAISRQYVKPLLNPNGTMGLGRNFTLKEAALEVICCGDAQVQPSNAVAAGTIAIPNTNNWDGNNTTGPTSSADPALNGLAVDATGYPTATPSPIPKTGKPLAAYEKRYQAGLFFQVQCTSPGNSYPNADLLLQVSGQNGITFAGAVNGPFPGHTPDTNPFYDSSSGSPPSGGYVMLVNGAGGNGAGYQSPGIITEPRTLFVSANTVLPPVLSTYPYSQPAAGLANAYYFISRPFTMPATVSGNTVSASPTTIAVSSATLTINIYQAHGATVATAPTFFTTNGQGAANPYYIQTITVTLPATTIPAPTLDISAPNTTPLGSGNTVPPDPSTPAVALNWCFSTRLPNMNASVGSYASNPARNVLYNPNDVIRGVSIGHGDTRLVAATPSVPASVFAPRTDAYSYTSSTVQMSTYFPNAATAVGAWTYGNILNPTTVPNSFTTSVPVNSQVPYLTQNPFVTRDWDNVCGNNGSPGAFINKPDEGDTTALGSYIPYFDINTGAYGGNVIQAFYTPNRLMPGPGMFGSLPTGVISGTPWQTLLFRPQVGNGTASDPGHPKAPYDSSGKAIAAQWPPDHLYMDLFWMPIVEPYAISEAFSTAGKINMNYQIVPFTYITRNTALRCLIQGGLNAASNSNTTGLYSGEKIFSVPSALPNSADVNPNVATDPAYYKTLPSNGVGVLGPNIPSFRSAVDCGTMSSTATGADPVGEIGRTFRQFKQRFNAGDIFRSPSEICDIYLTPLGQTFSTAGTFWPSSSDGETYWNNHLGTADNDRERPYTDLYGRLTTKSNTFLVHMRVQSIKQNPAEIAGNPAQWTEGTDVVTGEYRGSSLIERYIDPADPSLQDYAAVYAANPASGPTLNDLYKYRVVYNKQFAP